MDSLFSFWTRKDTETTPEIEENPGNHPSILPQTPLETLETLETVETPDEHPTHDPPVRISLPAKLAVGAVAGIFGTTCIYPIDIVKTRLQHQTPDVQGKLMYRGPIHAFRTILAKEGIRGLYRGLGANLVGVTPEKAIKLGVNDLLREKLADEDGNVTINHQILAGASAGFCQVIATNPMEVVKIRMQIQNLKPAQQRLTTFQVIRKLGIRGVYRGTPITLLRDIPYSIVFFPLYAELAKVTANEDGFNTIPSLLLSGGLAGAFAAWICTPADCIKTRLQSEGARLKYSGFTDCVKKTVAEGWTALFRGAVPRIAVMAPLFSLALMSFEVQKRFLAGEPIFAPQP